MNWKIGNHEADARVEIPRNKIDMELVSERVGLFSLVSQFRESTLANIRRRCLLEYLRKYLLCL